jgi:hypothetical protein
MLTIERIIPCNCIKKFSHKIRNTILYIIHEFFSNNENSIISIYDITDGRSEARKKLFDNWYNNFNSIGLSRMEGDVYIGDGKTTASLFYSSKNRFTNEITYAFQRIVSVNFYS